MPSYQTIIATPKGNVFNGETTSVNFSSTVGELTILANHINLTGVIEKTLILIDGDKKIGYAKDGVFTFYGNHLQIIVSKFEEELDKLNNENINVDGKLKFSKVNGNMASEILIEVELLKNIKHSK